MHFSKYTAYFLPLIIERNTQRFCFNFLSTSCNIRRIFHYKSAMVIPKS
nr:MAG TPA: hypothetical protein [Caudoviricetes sp.]